MTGHGHGHGGLMPRRAAGGGGGGALPESLSNLEIWLDGSDDCLTYSGSPLKVTAITNLAALEGRGGNASGLTFTVADPWYHNAVQWVPDLLGPPPAIPQLNGYAHWGGCTDIDSTRLPDVNDVTLTVTTPSSLTRELSGIYAYYMPGGDTTKSTLSRVIEGDGNPGYGGPRIGVYGRMEYHKNGGAFFPTLATTIDLYLNQWNIYTWSVFGDGVDLGNNTYYHAMNGVELAVDQVNSTHSEWNIKWCPHYGTYNLQSAELVVYKKAHSLEALNDVASSIATKLGITYEYTPLP